MISKSRISLRKNGYQFEQAHLKSFRMTMGNKILDMSQGKVA